MNLAQRINTLRQLPHRLPRRWSSTVKPVHQIDPCGIPLTPTWSVHRILSSYPTPELSDTTLEHLHQLAALIPPPRNSPEWVNLKKGIEEMVRLVEAVKLVDTSGVHVASRRTVEDADRQPHASSSLDELNGNELLQYASRTQGDFYLVDSDRKR